MPSGQEHVDFLLGMETALGGAVRHKKKVTCSPLEVQQLEENEHHVRTAMLVVACSYLEGLFPSPGHFHQQGYKERELTVFRAIRNALIHNKGSLQLTTSPNDAERKVRTFIEDVKNETELDPDNKPIPPYYEVDGNSFVTLNEKVFNRVVQVCVTLLQHTNHISR